MNDSERARLDYEWSHMNAVERTERLRSDIQSVRDQFTEFWALAHRLAKRSGESSRPDRISTHYEGDDCPGGHVTPAELARLRRIEEAALEVLQCWAPSVKVSWEPAIALNDACLRKPIR